MKNYELTYLISSDLTTEESKILSEKVANFIPELSGIIDNNLEPVKIKLGYVIKKSQEAYLASVSFSLNQEKLIELKKKVESESHILRHIIIVKIKRKERPIKERSRVMEKTKEQKVELENMDQKIDEILQ